MKTMECARSWCWFAAVAIAALAFAGGAAAATVYWTNTDAAATWTAPDSTHFSTAKIGAAGSPATYQNGDTVQFGDLESLPATDSTISLASGGVNPNTIYMYTPRYVNRITFNIDEDNALGTGSFDTDYGVSTTLNNTKGTGSANEITLGNNFIYGNSYVLVFTGGDFRLAGTVNGAGNGGPNLRPGAGVTLTVVNGMSGAATDVWTLDPSGAGSVLRILGASTCIGTVPSSPGGTPTIEVGADNAIGPAGKEFVCGSTAVELKAYGAPRTLANDFQRGMTVRGTEDLTLTGNLKLDNWRMNKYDSCTLILNGSNTNSANDWVNLYGGVLRIGNTNALKALSIAICGGVIELAAGDFTWALTNRPDLTVNTVGWFGVSSNGGFSAYGGNRFVNLGGASNQVTWGSGGFVPAGQTLIFGSSNANAQLDFQNPIALGDAVRTIQVNDNTNSTADRAVLSGVISGTVGNGLTKTGNGTLFFNAANTYTGATTVSAGSVGGNGSLSGSLTFAAGSGFVADWNALSAPLAVAGAVDLSNADTLTVLGTPPTKTRTVILTAAGGISGTFDTVSGPARWTVDYSVASQVALKPPPRGTVVSIR